MYTFEDLEISQLKILKSWVESIPVTHSLILAPTKILKHIPFVIYQNRIPLFILSHKLKNKIKYINSSDGSFLVL